MTMINLFHADYILIQDVKDSSQYIDQFHWHDTKSSLPIIPVMIDSIGGWLEDAYVLYQLIKACEKPVATFTLSKACSGGALLLCAGTKGYRFATENAKVFVHNALDDGNRDKPLPKLTKELMKYMDLNTNRHSFWYKTLKECGGKEQELNILGKNIKKLGLVDHIGLPIIDIDNLNDTEQGSSRVSLAYPTHKARNLKR